MKAILYGMKYAINISEKYAIELTQAIVYVSYTMIMRTIKTRFSFFV